MPKITQHPYLRSAPRKAKSGKVTTYYYYDRRHLGLPDVPLGKDWNLALAKWDELHNRRPRIVGTVEEAFQLFEYEKLGIGEKDGERAPPTEYTNKETYSGYTKALRWLRPVFGGSSWDAITLPHLVKFLRMRKGKTQANRNLDAFQVIWNFARVNGLTTLPWPAAGMERSGWKNKEKPREMEVTEDVFSSIYEQADQLLRDAMDLASATGMRVTDVRTVPLPSGDVLRLKSNKKGKKTDFVVSESPVLSALLARRKANKNAEHLMFLAGPFRKPVTYWHLQERFSNARAKAAAKARADEDEKLAQAVEAMFLRDCRRMAANLATSMEQARQLLQHDKATTTRIYRSAVDKVKPVR